ncbi:MAG: hypothetical protein KKC84_05335 [Candidatus Omnitrophica bacterium]|nr:hypothetical protein [Candidatus Omnitrophota bacterium]
MQKKSWRKPELIILARLRAEEAVLTSCKDQLGTPPSATVSGNLECTTAGCADCDAIGS